MVQLHRLVCSELHSIPVTLESIVYLIRPLKTPLAFLVGSQSGLSARFLGCISYPAQGRYLLMKPAFKDDLRPSDTRSKAFRNGSRATVVNAHCKWVDGLYEVSSGVCHMRRQRGVLDGHGSAACADRGSVSPMCSAVRLLPGLHTFRV